MPRSSQPSAGQIKPVELTAYKTSDGQYFENIRDASEHQLKVNFRDWCSKNICRGGEWSHDMVADAILENWIVVPK